MHLGDLALAVVAPVGDEHNGLRGAVVGDRHRAVVEVLTDDFGGDQADGGVGFDDGLAARHRGQSFTGTVGSPYSSPLPMGSSGLSTIAAMRAAATTPNTMSSIAVCLLPFCCFAPGLAAAFLVFVVICREPFRRRALVE